jgi:hypothetical protein
MLAKRAPVTQSLPASAPTASRSAPMLAAIHGLLAACAVVAATLAHAFIPVWLWLAASSLVVAYGYAFNRAGVFGKRDDGTIGTVPLLVVLPYVVAARCLFWLKLVLRREPCWHRVTDGICLGRWPRAWELPEDCALVVDLTAELEAHPDVVATHTYRCLPVLNRHVPSDLDFAELLDELRAFTGSIYVHCGAGRGRSAMVVAALLVVRGVAASARDAEQRLSAIRPGVRLHEEQRRIVDRYCATTFSGATR